MQNHLACTHTHNCFDFRPLPGESKGFACGDDTIVQQHTHPCFLNQSFAFGPRSSMLHCKLCSLWPATRSIELFKDSMARAVKRCLIQSKQPILSTTRIQWHRCKIALSSLTSKALLTSSTPACSSHTCKPSLRMSLQISTTLANRKHSSCSASSKGRPAEPHARGSPLN